MTGRAGRDSGVVVADGADDVRALIGRSAVEVGAVREGDFAGENVAIFSAATGVVEQGRALATA